MGEGFVDPIATESDPAAVQMEDCFLATDLFALLSKPSERCGFGARIS